MPLKSDYYGITPQLVGVRVAQTRTRGAMKQRSQEAQGEETMPHSSGKGNYPAKRGHPGKKAKGKGKK